MNTTRGQEGGLETAASPATAKGESPFSHAAAASSFLSNERNPLIEDLFDDSGQNSFLQDVCAASDLQGRSVSNGGNFSTFCEELGRARAGSDTSCYRSSYTPQLKEAVDVIRKTSQHFVHAMQVYELEDFFAPTGAEKGEDGLRRQLCSKDPQEVVAVVLSLVELLEEVRKASSHVSSLTGELSQPKGSTRRRASFNSMPSTVSTASLMGPPVHETNQVAMAYDQQGNRMINCYKVIADLGSGAYGKVKLGADVNTGQMVAIKMINKKLLKKKIGGLGTNNQEAALKREIAIMKKVRHRNCVSLYEVIDDPDSNMLYLIMEYVPNGPVVRLKPQELGSAALESIEGDILLNGEICNKTLIRCAVRQSAAGGVKPLTVTEITSNPTVFLCKPLSQHICALYLRQLVSGLRYMHKRHLVHHDIKPDNILLGTNHRVFLTDFGVSEILSTRHEAKDGEKNGGKNRDNASCDRSPRSDSSASTDGDGKAGNTPGRARLGGGTLLFTAPELFDSSVDQRSLDPHLTDVWALGVTLYCMLVGMSPFSGNSYSELRKSILTQTYPWCDKTVHGAPLAAEWRIVLKGLLAKDPAKRWSLMQLKSFLDQESFQDAMRQSAVQEASLRNSSSTHLHGDASVSSTVHCGTGCAKPSRAAAPATGLEPSPALASIANSSSPTSPPSRTVSSFAPISASLDRAENTALGFSWDLSVSEQEVRDATRKVRVEVMRQRTVLSPGARALVRRYVESISASLLDRNFIPLSSASPLVSTSCADSPVYMRMPTKASKSRSVINRRSETASSTQVPVLVAAAKFHQTSEVDSISARPLLHVMRGCSRSQARTSLAVARASGSLSVSGSGGRVREEGNVANHNTDCRLQSLDGALSIVNLQSSSDVQSAVFSLSSSASSWQSSSPLGPGGHYASRAPVNNNGVLVSNFVTPSEFTRMPGSEVAATAVGPKVQAPSTVAHTMIHDSAASSLFSEGDGRQRSGTNGNKGPLMKCTQPPKTLSSATRSGGLASDQATSKLKPHPTATPLRDSILYSAFSCTGESTSGGYPSTSTSPKALRVAERFPAKPSRKATPPTRSSGFPGSVYPVEPAQHRLCDTKLVESVLTSYEEVPYIRPPKPLAAVFRKGA